LKTQTIFFKNPAYIREVASIAGPKEAEGPIGSYFDKTVEDDSLGQKSFERAEVMMHTTTLKYLLNKAKMRSAQIDLCVSGDLSDEITGANFTMRSFDIPFLGIYSACASFAESIIVGSTFIDAGHMDRVICSVSSHFSSAERQYRFPLELGNQRTPLSQWTVTAAGALILDKDKGEVKVECATLGTVIDYGVKDANDLGAAMAPAATATLVSHFRCTGRKPDYYDAIFTGDLGEAGSRILRSLMIEEGYPLPDSYNDCGVLIFNREGQKVGQGGSGAACSASVFCSYIYKKMLNGELNRVLLVPTGALLSKTSGLQGETIPSIAHAVSFVKVQ